MKPVFFVFATPFVKETLSSTVKVESGTCSVTFLTSVFSRSIGILITLDSDFLTANPHVQMFSSKLNDLRSFINLYVTYSTCA